MAISKIGLGSVQWGMSYGVSNSNGQTKNSEVESILALAREEEIDLIDTASLYGRAENALGLQNLQNFKIISKTPKFINDITQNDAVRLHKTCETTLGLLKVDRLHGLLIHRAEDLLLPGGNLLVDALLSLKSQGIVQKIGVSIYEPSSLKRLCDFFIPDIVQAPINVLDRRLIEDSILDDLHNLGVEIHARSIFLQGLLLMPVDKIPNYFLPWNSLLEAWHLSCRLQGVSLLQGALSFMESLNFIDYYILGVETSLQLKEIIEALKDPISFNSDGLSSYDPNLIYPNKWRLS